jgi:hypothetical protein
LPPIPDICEIWTNGNFCDLCLLKRFFLLIVIDYALSPFTLGQNCFNRLYIYLCFVWNRCLIDLSFNQTKVRRC